MQFEYQIDLEEYVAGQLVLRGSRRPTWRYEYAIAYCFVGTVIAIAAWNERALWLICFVLAGVGARWFYAAFGTLLPAIHYRQRYKKSEVIGKRYAADVNEKGFDVNGQDWGWRVQWSGVRDKGEDERVFMFHAANTLFIIGKKYLSEDQQKELRKLAGLG